MDDWLSQDDVLKSNDRLKQEMKSTQIYDLGRFSYTVLSSSPSGLTTIFTKRNTHVNGFLAKNDAKCNFKQNYFSNW